MKAIVYTQYGSPDVLQLQEVEKPTPQDNEVLIQVYASTVTPTDCAFLKADPFIIRFMNGLRTPKNKILGNLLAGKVEAIGKDVTLFKVGDEIFGNTDTDFGAHAEYICLTENTEITIKPANMTYEEIVGAPEAMTAIYFLQNLAKVQAGQKVLINGASGAVGTAAVQIAKYFGAEVTGVCSTRNVDLVKSLGADSVIDYTQTDFGQNGETYDVIFDVVGKRSYRQCKNALTNNGMYLTTVPSLMIIPQMLWTSKIGSKKAIIGFAGLNKSQENLEFLKELVETGKLKVINDRTYPLEEIAEAYRYVETERKKGNVIITVA